MRATPLPTIDLLGMPLARVTQQSLLDHIFRSSAIGQGGWLITANLDFMSLTACYAGGDL